MLGSMIKKIRKDKHLTKVSIAEETQINIGHLTHIEKGERFPSHKALKLICKSLDVPFSFMSSLYDNPITEDQKRYEVLNHLSYNKIVAFDSIDNFVECTSKYSTASLALKVKNDEMDPILKKDSYAYIELNVPLNNKDIGLFKLNDRILMRRFIIRKDKLVLRADNKNYEDIDLSENDNFTIIGKILNTNK